MQQKVGLGPDDPLRSLDAYHYHVEDDAVATPNNDVARKESLKKELASKRWQDAKQKVVISASMMQQKVGLGNKIGIPARDLEPDDPLRTIAMSSERALRHFGKEYYKQNKESNTIEKNSDDDAGSPKRKKPLPINGRFDKMLRATFKSGTTTIKEANCLKFHPTNRSVSEASTTVYMVSQPSFECYDLFPNIFLDIRRAFHINEVQYYAIMGLQHGRNESAYSVISSKDASGKSSSFFFLSSDQRFILKSCTAQDVQTLCKILPKYRDYVVKQQEQHHSSRSKDETTNEEKAGAACGTLLPRYLGLYTLKFPDNTELPDVTLIVMVNFFASIHKVDTKFDLKGSSYHRVASEKERSKKQPVYKDNDWISMGKKLTFPTEQMKASIHTQLQMDTAFLTRHNLMDYSLLVGIHDLEHDDDTTKMEDSSTISECMGVISCCTRKEIRYFGIIDILTEYGLLKQLETFFTGYFICEPTTISCQPPHKYAARFCDFAQQHILHTDSGARLSVYAVDQQPLSEEEDDLDQSPLP